ncbi:MAG: site-specific DNA-methyltransferase [Anaerolineales bacterium]|jgi:adenine-specific DNA-methyltransferase
MPKQSVPKTTPSLTDEQLQALQTLIPQAFAEGRIDSEKLLASLGDIVDDRPERYSFSWAGKRDAIRLLQVPSRATLLPARDESLDFDTTQNLFIEGDNLEVLKLLYKPYFGRVKMIYIDPPYNTGNDFVYPDNFADPLDTYLQLTGQKDRAGNLLTSNPETGGRYHSAWLSMMYPRLFLAYQLLSEDGVIFVSIDDHEVFNLRLLMNEVFGEENFFTTIVVQSNKRGQTYKQIAKTHEYMLVFTKSSDSEIRELEKSGDNDDLNLSDEIGRFNIRELRNRNPKFGRENRPNLYYPIYVNQTLLDKDGFCPISLAKDAEFSVEIFPLDSNGRESCWRWEKKLTQKNISASTITSNLVAKQKTTGEYGIFEKYRKTTYKAKTIWDEKTVISEKGTMELGEIGLSDYFDFPKPVFLIKKALMLSTEEDDIILDFFSGSCTTAQAVLELNREDGGDRRFIMVQLQYPTGNQQFSTIVEIGKERIRRVVARMKNDRAGQLALDKPEDLGFKVFKLAPSNYRQWDDAQPDATAYTHQAEMFADPLISGWQPENVLYEVALKEGYGLNLTVEPTAVKGVQLVSDPDKGQSFYITLAAKIALEELRPLDLKKDNLFICRDTALDDEAAANLALQCRLKTI